MRLQLERYLIITVDVNGVDRRIVRRAKFFEPQTGWNGVLKELLYPLLSAPLQLGVELLELSLKLNSVFPGSKLDAARPRNRH